MSSPQEMWEALPPVTKCWLGASIASSAFSTLGMVSPYKLVLIYPLVFNNYELWRLLTNFCFFGNFSFNTLIQFFILARFSGSVEVDPYQTSTVGGTADYVFSLLVMATIDLVIAWLFGYMLMSKSLIFSVLYLWSKRNPDAPTTIWWFKFKGSQLPWALIAFSVLTGGDPMGDIIGVVVGHVFYFCVEVVPLSNGTRVLRTPEWLIRFVHNLTGQQYVPPAGQPSNPARHNWGQGRALGGN
mmetsp:Transcript_13842/g.22583  ORF Transcript_13842/g.22583 Transcript_13842/m.22583 type:complete len:242 (+) Transcript_13842:70-795(+)